MFINLYEQLTLDKIINIKNMSVNTKEHYVVELENGLLYEFIRIDNILKIKTYISTIVVELINEKECKILNFISRGRVYKNDKFFKKYILFVRRMVVMYYSLKET